MSNSSDNSFIEFKNSLIELWKAMLGHDWLYLSLKLIYSNKWYFIPR